MNESIARIICDILMTLDDVMNFTAVSEEDYNDLRLTIFYIMSEKLKYKEKEIRGEINGSTDKNV